MELVVPQQWKRRGRENLSVLLGKPEPRAPVSRGLSREDDFQAARFLVEAHPLVPLRGIVSVVESDRIDEVTIAGAVIEILILRFRAVIGEGTGDAAIERIVF